MSRENRVNPGMYTQRGRLTQDDAARELRKQSAFESRHLWQPVNTRRTRLGPAGEVVRDTEGPADSEIKEATSPRVKARPASPVTRPIPAGRVLRATQATRARRAAPPKARRSAAKAKPTAAKAKATTARKTATARKAATARKTATGRKTAKGSKRGATTTRRMR